MEIRNDGGPIPIGSWGPFPRESDCPEHGPYDDSYWGANSGKYRKYPGGFLFPTWNTPTDLGDTICIYTAMDRITR